MADPTAALERSDSPGMQQQQQQRPLAASHETAQRMDPEQQLRHHSDQSQVNEPVPPPFQPLFTLVTDSITRTTRHPQVHYIFSDDDPQLLTDALADHAHQHLPPSSHDSSPNASTSHNPQNPPLSNHVNERAILLDLVPKTTSTSDDPTSSSAAATGFHVQWASSLSADWAITSAKITTMVDDTATVPSDTQGSEASDGAPRLMLRIEGVDVASGVPPASTRTGKPSTSAVAQTSSAAIAGGRRPSLEERELRMSASGGGGGGGKRASPGGPGAQGNEDYGAIVEEFDKRMGMLRKVIDAGLERQQYITTAASREQQSPGPHGGDEDDGQLSCDRPK